MGREDLPLVYRYHPIMRWLENAMKRGARAVSALQSPQLPLVSCYGGLQKPERKTFKLWLDSIFKVGTGSSVDMKRCTYERRNHVVMNLLCMASVLHQLVLFC